MKVIEKGVMPDGTKVQLEDWGILSSEAYPDFQVLAIAAYPIAKNADQYNWFNPGEKFRLSIPRNDSKGYINDRVSADYTALISGEKRLEDLTDYFWNGSKDMWRLGMDVEYRGW